MYEILLVSFLIVAISLVLLILIQHGKGADMGASFGAGASATVFGSSGSGNFLTRITAIMAALFFVIALSLAYLTANQNKGVKDTASKIEDITKPAVEEIPATENTGIPAVDTKVDTQSLESAIPDATEAVDAAKAVTEEEKPAEDEEDKPAEVEDK